MEHAPKPWRYDAKRRTVTHKSGLVILFHSALECEVEYLPKCITTLQLRELVREAEEVYARESTCPTALQKASLPVSGRGLRGHRLSLKKKVTEPV